IMPPESTENFTTMTCSEDPQHSSTTKLKDAYSCGRTHGSFLAYFFKIKDKPVSTPISFMTVEPGRLYLNSQSFIDN
ncbi:hypothetical protein AJ78_08991, partial [Emergomyces pasteurianus Ep9510]